jgi:hypothetical protein
VAVGHTSAGSCSLCNHSAVKEDIVEQKIICIEKRMDLHKYVISSDFFDLDEKRIAKADLRELIE